MSNGSSDGQHASGEDQQQDQSATDTPGEADDQTRKAGAVHHLKRAFDAVKGFISRQKVPAFLLFYRDHWRDLLQHVRDGLSQPTDNELWIRGSDPSPGVFREEHAWDIEAAHYCAICGRLTDEPRRRVRSVVRDYDGMVYGLLVTVVVMIVVRVATASSIAAVASLFMGLWCARRLIVEEKVRIDCSTCAEHAGREETLPLRLKRDTLIVELGGRKARLAFLRKLRDISGETGWDSQKHVTGRRQSSFTPPAPPLTGSDDAESDLADADHPTGPLTEIPLDSSGTDSAADEAPARIPLADSDDSNPVEFRTFTVHDSDGASIDAPIASKQDSRSEPPSHYFQPRTIDTDETGDSSSAHRSTTELTDDESDGSAVGNVLVPESEGPAETIPLVDGPAAASESDGRWFVKIDGVEIGPVPLEQVHRLKAAGTLKPTDLVRREHEPNWSRSDSISTPEASTPPPMSEDKVQQRPNADPWTEPTDDADAPWDPWAE
jgi:hypothetical protein